MNTNNRHPVEQAPARIDWGKAIVAGLAGTVLFDLSGFLLTGQWWDIPELLGAKLGIGFLGGLAAHYSNGAALAIIYAALAPSLFGPRWFRGVSYITAQTILGVWLFMLPLLGAGIAGVEASVWTPLISLARHFAYVLPLIALIPVAVRHDRSEDQKEIEGKHFQRPALAPSLF